MAKRGRPEQTPLGNLSHLRLQRWRVYGDDWRFKQSICCNCAAKFEEPAHTNLMACPVCADALWKRKNYPPQVIEWDAPNTGCPWCGKPPKFGGKYCDEWCREAKSRYEARERQRRRRGTDGTSL